MIYHKFFAIALILLFLLVPKANAQQFWSIVKFDKEINKDFGCTANTQLRVDKNFTEYNSFIAELGLWYGFSEYIECKVSYRYTDKAGKSYSELHPVNNKERYTADIKLKFGKDLKISYRLRYHLSKEFNVNDYDNYLRNRLTLSYKLHSLARPFVSTENYFKFDNKNEVRAMSYIIGLDSKINDRITIESFFRFEQELNVKYPEGLFIFGILANFKI